MNFRRLSASFLVACGVMLAHHGTPGSYDQDKSVTLKGTVTQFSWANPHVAIYFDVKDDQGNVVHWGGESNSPSVLAKAGWSKNSLKPGDEITITLHPSIAGAPVGEFMELTFPDGRVLSKGNGGARAAQ